MSATPGVLSKIAEQGGSTAAVGIAAGWFGGVFHWLNVNSTGVIALSALIGAVVGVLGHISSRRDAERRFEADLRRWERPEDQKRREEAAMALKNGNDFSIWRKVRAVFYWRRP